MENHNIDDIANETMPQEDVELFNSMKDHYVSENERIFFDNMQRKEEDESYRQVHAESVPRYRKWLQQTLDALGLDYTIEEFEEEF
jgi:hypothetical protein